jgi:archaellum biogenesis ATPase FlaH
MNSPTQGHLSGVQIRGYMMGLWLILPVFYIITELLFWVVNTDKTNWNLDKYPKNTLHVLLNHKALVLASILLVYSATFFIYGVLLGVVTFPLLVIALWKL